MYSNLRVVLRLVADYHATHQHLERLLAGTRDRKGGAEPGKSRSALLKGAPGWVGRCHGGAGECGDAGVSQVGVAAANIPECE